MRKRTHTDEDCPICDQELNQKASRARSTAFYTSSDSSKHCSYKCLRCLVNLTMQQDIETTNTPFSLSNPWHRRACCRAAEATLVGQARVLYTSHRCLLCWSAPVKGNACHSNATVEATHFSTMPAGEKDSVQPHLSHQVLRWTSSRKDATQSSKALWSAVLPMATRSTEHGCPTCWVTS